MGLAAPVLVMGDGPVSKKQGQGLSRYASVVRFLTKENTRANDKPTTYATISTNPSSFGEFGGEFTTHLFVGDGNAREPAFFERMEAKLVNNEKVVVLGGAESIRIFDAHLRRVGASSVFDSYELTPERFGGYARQDVRGLSTGIRAIHALLELWKVPEVHVMGYEEEDEQHAYFVEMLKSGKLHRVDMD